MLEYLGFGCALAIGIILGLTGTGGAILTVPVLVYVLGLNPIIATGYSLFIVGTTAATGTITNIKNGIVEIKTGLLYALPSLVGVYVARKHIVPALPDFIMETDGFSISKEMFLMVLFAGIMILAAVSMLRGLSADEKESAPNKISMSLQVFVAGLIVGLVGAGGGFLFVPFLLHVAKLPMKKAAATSLMIIAINSLIGFTGDLQNIPIDWIFLFIFTSLAIIGIFTGIYLNRFVNEKQLKKGFGWFVLVMAFTILSAEIIF